MAGGSGNCRKSSRNKVFCEKYSKENRRHKAKIRRLTKYISSNPGDKEAPKWLEYHDKANRIGVEERPDAKVSGGLQPWYKIKDKSGRIKNDIGKKY